MRISDRLKKLPPYIFIEIDKKKKAAIAAGRDIINISIGDPDKPTPEKIVNYMKEVVGKPSNHVYPIGRGAGMFKNAIKDWFERRFDVEIKDSEILVLLGGKDGITHLPIAFTNPGDVVLIPEPGYPGYTSGTILAGAECYYLPITKENNFLPDLDAVPPGIYEKTKMLHLNYPNNPTSAMADMEFYEKALMYAQKYDFIISQDMAYSETYFKQAPISMLQIDGAKDHVIETYSMSKTYNMTGWRVGFAVGGEKIIDALGTVKESMDSGTFTAIQETSAWILQNCDDEAERIRELYKKRAEVFYKGLKELGYELDEPLGTLYLWVKCPGKYTSMEFAAKVLEDADMVVTPGVGFGRNGDKYFRIALTVDVDKIKVALERFKKLKI